MQGKVSVTRRYISTICGANTPEPIPTKIGVLVGIFAPQNIIKMSNYFCNKIFRGFVSDLLAPKSLFFIDLLRCHRYNSALYTAACDIISALIGQWQC